MVVCPAGPTRDFARIDSAGAQEADIVLVKSIASTADGLGSVGVTADEHTHTHTHTNIRGQMASNQRLQFSFTPYRCRKHTPQVLLAQYRRVCGMASFSLHTNERVTQQMLQCASVLVCQCRLRSIQRRGKILGGRPLLPLPSSPLSQILFALTHDRQRTRKQRTWLGHSAFLHTCNLLGHCTQRNKDTRQKCEGKIDGGT